MKAKVSFSRKVFNARYYPYLDAPQRIQIFFGGSSSGKSYFAAQRRVRNLLKGGRNYLCVRNVGVTLKSSIFNETTKAISKMGLSDLFRVNKSDLTITCRNGYQAIFKGLDDIEKIKSITPEKGVLTNIDVEEATECKLDALRQLNKRLRGKTERGITKVITLLFNPILKSHWIYREFFVGKWVDDKDIYEDEDVLIVHSTYRDNDFLELDDIANLENEQDEYYYKVYTLGLWGVLGGMVFNNFSIADLANSDIFKTFSHFRNGLDFGYTNDPTALIRSHYDRAKKTIYITHEWRATGVTNDVIAQEISPIVGRDIVVCDSSEPKSIKELKNHGINAIGAKKGKDSVKHGIQWLQQQIIVIDRRCQETINEFELYHWRKDRDGNSTNEPADKNNHFIDGLRYSHEDIMLEKNNNDFNIISISSPSTWNF